MAPTVTTGSGVMLTVIREHPGLTRSDLGERLGWSRVTVGKRLEALLTGGYIVATGQLDSTGGRRPDTFALNAAAGLLLAADIGSSHSRLGITDLASNVLIEAEVDIDVATGPERVLGWSLEVFTHLLRSIGGEKADVRGIGVGVPGPVNPRTGRLVNPPIMPGWDGVLVSDHLASHYDAVITVDRDANLMALGEHRIGWPNSDNFALVKLGLGLSLGFVIGGRVFRGSIGAAGDLGHIRHGGTGVCRCGTTGCLEATASGWAIRRELVALGYPIQTSLDIVALADRGNRDALELLADAGKHIGEALADMVGFIDPSVIVIGGNLAAAGEPLLDPIRAAIVDRVQPFQATTINIATSKVGVAAGVIGASLMAQDALFEPDLVSRATKGQGQGITDLRLSIVRHSQIRPAPSTPRMTMTSLADELSDTAIVVGAVASDWQEAITLAGDALERSGIATHVYTAEMIDAVTKLGPYIVIAPGIALAHSRPSSAVLRTGLSWVQLASPVEFGNPKNDPVSLVIGLAAADHESHLALMSALAAVLMDKETMRKLHTATDSKAIKALLNLTTATK